MVVAVVVAVVVLVVAAAAVVNVVAVVVVVVVVVVDVDVVVVVGRRCPTPLASTAESVATLLLGSFKPRTKPESVWSPLDGSC